jgi:hypothetical protein
MNSLYILGKKKRGGNDKLSEDTADYSSALSHQSNRSNRSNN